MFEIKVNRPYSWINILLVWFGWDDKELFEIYPYFRENLLLPNPQEY